MTTQIKRRRGTTLQHSTFAGAEAEITIDTDKNTVVVHDGSTAGGYPLAKASEVVAKAGDTMTGNLSFGDNNKAIFGAGSDLQIYHNGFNSYITDIGTGDLVIGADTFTYIANSAGSKTSATFNASGAVTLRYDNAAKLATTSTGVDVTGNTLSDSLTANGSLSGLNAGSVMLDYSGLSTSRLLAVGADATTTGILKVVSTASDGGPYIEAMTISSTGVDVTGTITSDGLTVEDAGIIQLTKNTTAAGDSLGILEFHDEDGTATADAGKFQLQAFRGGDKDAPDFKLIGSDSTGVLRDRIQVEANGNISFYEDTGTTAKMVWKSADERLGIGTSSPADKLHVKSSTQAVGDYQIIAEGVTGGYGAGISFQSPVTGGSLTEMARITADGEDAWNTTASTQDAGLRFYTSLDGSVAERIRIDSSGNLLIGGTVTPTSSAKNLVLHNGTAPTGSATDGVILYAEDVSSSSELKVRDEAGNVTTLSPHNFDLIPEGPSEDMAWSYYSERDGKRINVDMLKAIRLLEQISGEKLVHMV